MMDGEKEKLKQKRYNTFYMDVAKRVSEMSYAKRLKVGSILVKEGNIISFGWNGTPAGWDNDCEEKDWTQDGDYILKTKPEVLHSEQNLLMKMAKSTNSSENADLFVTHAPCLDCAKLIHQAGIRRVFYRHTYRSEDGLDFLKKCEIETQQIGENNVV